MLILSRTVFFSNTVRRRLIHATSIYNSLTNQETVDLKRGNRYREEVVIDFSNSAIEPFLNVDKINLLKEFRGTKNEMTCTYNFTIDENVAKNIVDKIITNDGQQGAIMAEGNPGLGLITLNLITSGVPHILVCDDSKIEDIVLKQLIASYPERITKIKANMNKKTDCILLNSLDFSRKLGVPVTIIGVSTSYYFMRGLVIHCVKYNLWENQFNIFLVLSSAVTNGIRQQKQKHFKYPIHCMFHLLFTVDEIAKYPREAFLPQSKENSEDMNLVKISINQKAFEMIDMAELNDYFGFLKILGTSFTNFIIPTLEKWIPNCGLYLISKGISMTTQVGDLSYEEAVRLFHFFKECEGYSDFKSCTAHFFQEPLIKKESELNTES